MLIRTPRRARVARPGLISAALRATEIPAANTLLVGDHVRDIQAARAAGVAALLVQTGKGGRSLAALRERGEVLPVFADLAEIAACFANLNPVTAHRESVRP